MTSRDDFHSKPHAHAPTDDAAHSTVRRELFESVVLQYDEALQSGAAPPATIDAPLTTDEQQKFAELADCLRMLDEERRTRDSQFSPADLELNSPGTDRNGWSSRRGVEPGDQIGRFEIQEELGRGGHGIVFAAFDPSLGRTVALKVARPEVIVDDQMRLRFLREAQAAGRLRHPNVVVVHEVGGDGPLCYIASDYCEGPSLSVWLKSTTAMPAVTKAAQMVAALADGVESAHQAGVLHRDIKPSNILLEPRNPRIGLSELDQYVPRLTDFGLAKLDGADEATRTGMLLGTPAYMAPEQASGQLRAIGPATDTYALGILLYELLTGTTPLRGENDADTLRRICSEDPLPPHRLRAGLPRDLEAICLKAIERSPARRYATAAELADDLRRFLTGQPTIARRVGATQRALKWIRRRPAAAALIVVSSLAIVVLLAGGWITTLQQSHLAQQADEARQTAEASAARARQLLYAAEIQAAQAAWNRGRVEQARAILATYIPKAGEADLREFAWRSLWRLTHQHQITFRGHEGAVYRALMTADGAHVVTCGQDGTVRLWNAGTAEQLAVFRGHTGEVNVLAVSPDSKWIVSGGDDGSIRRYDIDARREVQALRDRGPAVTAVAFSQRGHLLATGGKEGAAEIWGTTTWAPVAQLSEQAGAVECLSFGRDDAFLAVGGERLCLWNVANRSIERTFEGFRSDVSSVSFDAAGHHLAAGSRDRTAAIWDLRAVAPPQTIDGHTAAVHAAHISKDARLLATASGDGTAAVWNARTGERQKMFLGHTDRVWSVEFTPQSDAILSASADGTAKRCQLAEPYTVVADQATGFPSNLKWRSIKFAPDGKSFAAGGTSGQHCAAFFDAASGTLVRRLQFERELIAVGFPHSGKLMAGWSFDRVGLIDIATGQETGHQIPWQRFTCALFQSRGDLLALGGYPVMLWDIVQKRHVATLEGDSSVPVQQLATDEREQWLAALQGDGKVRVWDFASRQTIADFDSGGASVVIFTPAADLLTGGQSGMVRRWSPQGRELDAGFYAETDHISALAISPDSTTLAVAGSNEIGLWDLRTQRRLLALPQSGGVESLAFSPDGQTLLSGDESGQLLSWKCAAPDEQDRPHAAKPRASWSTVETTAYANFEYLPLTVPSGVATLQRRTRLAHNWANGRGFLTAMPTYSDRETTDGLVLRFLMFAQSAAKPTQAHHAQLYSLPKPAHLADNEFRQHCATHWALAHGGAAGFLDYHQGRDNIGTHGHVYILDSTAVEVRQIPSAELERTSTFEERLRSIQPYAVSHGYVGGYPSYLDSPAEQTIGVVLLKPGIATLVEIPAETLQD